MSETSQAPASTVGGRPSAVQRPHPGAGEAQQEGQYKSLAKSREDARSTESRPPGVRTLRRSADRKKASPLAKIGMAVFAVGMLAVFADLAMFASGSRDLPLWVNLTAALAPIGLVIGLFAVVFEARKSTT